MGCTHTETCPLFPLLNASMRAWRDYYCDSAEGWRDCARYKVSARGRVVPISLLPNGRDALHLRHAAEAAPGPALVSSAPVGAGSAQAAAVSLFEPAPAPVEEPEEPAVAQVPQQRVAPEPAPEPEAPAPVRRRWWARLVEWMRGAA